MAKTSGLGDRLLITGYDLSGDIGSLGAVSGGPALFDVTGIDKLGMERLGATRDGKMEFTAFYNPGAELNAAHTRLSTLPTTDVTLSYLRGTTLGDTGAGLVAKQANYDGKRSGSGEFTLDVAAAANGFGIEWGVQGTAGLRADTVATNGASIDYGATVGTSTFGLQLYVQLTAFTGTSVTVSVQGSTDNGGADPFAAVTGATTTALTGVGAVRVATGATSVKRYLRVITAGTFTVATFSALIVRNPVAVSF